MSDASQFEGNDHDDHLNRHLEDATFFEELSQRVDLVKLGVITILLARRNTEAEIDKVCASIRDDLEMIQIVRESLETLEERVLVTLDTAETELEGEEAGEIVPLGAEELARLDGKETSDLDKKTLAALTLNLSDRRGSLDVSKDTLRNLLADLPPIPENST